MFVRSKRGLEEWRNQARLKQKQKEQMVQDEGKVSFSQAVDTAPFATGESVSAVVHVQDTTSVGNEQRVLRYRTDLEEKRKQAGIISNPSSQLREAEKALAEV